MVTVRKLERRLLREPVPEGVVQKVQCFQNHQKQNAGRRGGEQETGGAREGVVDGGEVAGVIGGAADHGVLVERGQQARRHRLWTAPALMTAGDAEDERPGGEAVAAGSGGKNALFGGIDL